jgi:hypothetical protein
MRWTAPLLIIGLSLCAFAASADTLESALSPGKLISGHAKFDNDCSKCHVRFNKAGQMDRCLDCHKDVARDVQSNRGFHGRLRDKSCRGCHTEHKGRHVNIAPLDSRTFDHRQTDFLLRGAHANPKVECRHCHLTGKKFRDAPMTCVACHKKDDKHRGRLGSRCSDCHTETNWKTTRFDHSKTRFPLTGKHIDVPCRSCHADPSFKGASTQCVACHRKDDKHKQRFGTRCESCHTDRDWKRITFDHDRDTKYRLKGKHRFTQCERCHTGFLFKEKTSTVCIACHRKDDAHKGRYGEKCASCHVESAWKPATFDHNRQTRYPLRGKHASVRCDSCHTGHLFRNKLTTACVACHLKDDKHKGQEGKKCDSCHSERSWRNALFDHELTRFPLLGAHAKVECKKCHVTPAFKDAKTACISCHRKDDKHKLRLGPRCEDCHNARSWKAWNFDHDRRTSFRLDGGHFGLQCEACHKRPMPSKVSVGTTCASCHEVDDVHDGRFGRQCERCHVTSSFKKIRPGIGMVPR